MEKNYANFIWSDNWWIEDNKAWFVDGWNNILCCINLCSQRCEMVISIPDLSFNRFRLNPHCIKCGNDIYCLPDCGNSIWIYNTATRFFSKITMTNPGKVRISINDFWKCEDKIFAVSMGLKKIIEIDTALKKIENQYTICDKENIAKSIMIGKHIYILLSDGGCIYEFNIDTMIFQKYYIPNMKKKVYTLYADDNEFWISGYEKEIYILNKNNSLNIIDDFPQDFGIYNFINGSCDKVDCKKVLYETPTFLYSISVGEYIWYIPCQTNKIVFIDKKTYELHVFEIEEENEIKERNIRNGIEQKYILEYVKDNRYIGMFSFMHASILEIDTLKLTYKYKKYYIGIQCIKEYAYALDNILYEIEPWQRNAYIKMLHMNDFKIYSEEKTSIGKSIYNNL